MTSILIKFRVIKGKNKFIKAVAPKSMQETESNMVCGDVENLTLGTLFGIIRQSLVMPSSDPRDRIVYPIHRLMIDSYNPYQC